MSSSAIVLHSCGHCSHLVYSFGHYPAFGRGHVVNDFKDWLSTEALTPPLRRVFVFSIDVDEAKLGEEQGCEFLKWVAPKDSATGKWLRANFHHYKETWGLSFDWVNKPDELWRIGTEELTIQATEE